MASLIQVYNAACSFASIEPVAANDAIEIDDLTTPQARACDVHFPGLYQAMVSLAEWPWAIERSRLSVHTLIADPSDPGYLDANGYPKLEAGSNDFNYRYELPDNVYPFDAENITYTNTRKVRLIGIVEPAADADDESSLSGRTEERPQARKQVEGRYMLSDYLDTPRPSLDEPPDVKRAWLPTLTIRYVAEVDVRRAEGPFLEALQAIFGAILARKFKRPQATVSALFNYGQIQLRFAFESLPDPVDYKTLTFNTVVDASPEAQ